MNAAVALPRALFAAVATTPVYRWLIDRHPPRALAVTPPDPWPGDGAEADQIFQGRFRFAGEEVRAPNQPPWHPRDVGPAFLERLEGFAWLRHFAAAGGETARRHARGLVGSWIAHHPQATGIAFDPPVVARRLMAFIGHYHFLTEDAEEGFILALLRSINAQARFLRWTAAAAEPGAGRIAVGSGLVIAGVALPDGAALLRSGLALLEREIGAQILIDGTHISRNPAQHLAVLRDLVVAREALVAAAQDVPEALRNGIDRLAPAIRFFRHGDGGLALFHGGKEMSGTGVEVTLAQADAAGKAPPSLPHGGFERLAVKRTIAIVDVGTAAPGVPAHASPLAFELSIGRHRVFVNCGASERVGSEWTRALRATAAHSTLTIEDAHSIELDGQGRLTGSPPNIALERNESGDGVWLEARHDGYLARFGLLHHRRLYLDPDGDDLRGEDRLIGAAGAGRHFTVRFHLHPSVHTQRTADGRAALLRVEGMGFRFRASGAELSLEESVYLGQNGPPRRTEQLVLSGRTDGDETVVKWALRKES